ncbi:cytochrome c oxidase assembly protein [Phytohalomonas tamaricis]|uniref:cytochrome c oxidase assembly protein n=1 Tax=Phytohalomonas tamaricis TaxID=2081032 RepID=UPI0021D453C8|nr:cytochrome c oxidase assembly protein [Phytohalomonas tamaricis]
MAFVSTMLISDTLSPSVGTGGVFIILIALLALYLQAHYRFRRVLSPWRPLSFTLGIALLFIAFSPPLMVFAHHDLRGHMLQHLLLGMFAPLGLILGAPGTLLLRSVPVSMARRLVALLATRPVRILIHPVSAALLDIGGMYVLYLTPLYALSMTNPVIHGLLHVHFILSGCLFTWAIAGPDPAPHRPTLKLRLAVLFVATAAHATLAKVMYGFGFPRGVASTSDVQAAAQWMYYGGDAAELILIIAFFTIWFRRYPRRTTPRSISA